jgi:hypothetical protein
MRPILLAACFALAAPAAGCEKETDTEEEVQTGEVDLDDDRSELRQRTDSAIARTERAIEDLERRAAEAGDDSRAMYDEAIAELREARDATKRAYDRAAAASSETWEDTKRETSELLDAMQRSYNEALEKLKSDEGAEAQEPK